MKHINLILLLFVICQCKAQIFTYSESLADKVVAGQKTYITKLLGEEENLKHKQRSLLRDLQRFEDSYSDKRNPISNSATGAIVGATEITFRNIESKIRAINHNLKTFRFASLGLSGLKRYENQLEREQKYLSKLKEESTTLTYGLVFSGSAGANYTAYLKLLIKLVAVKNNILIIDKEIKAKMTVTKIFAK